MAKYIDADKLKAEIEKRAKFHDDAVKACTGLNNIAITHSAGWKEDTELIALVTSLQQEQPEVDLVAKLKHHLDTTPKEQLEKEWKDLEKWNDVGPTVQEFLYGKQPEVDLEKEIRSMWEKCEPTDEGMGVESAYMHIEAFDIIARHFYELGKNSK